jgi:arylamine N-acetyltransferase
MSSRHDASESTSTSPGSERSGPRDTAATRLPDGLATAYLEHLEVDARPDAVDTAILSAIVRAHVERVVWENVDIFRGAPPAIDPLASVERILAGRGGYCYHLNGALAVLLEWLEVDVTRHVSGVHGRGLPSAPGPNANHLGLTARMPDGTEWLVDVGLGDGPGEPLPLTFGVYERDGVTYRLSPSAFDADGWRLDHDVPGSFLGVDFSRATASTSDFLEMHEVLSTSPESRFMKVVSISRRVPSGLEGLRGCVHTRITASEVVQRDVADAGEWWDLVVDGFGLAYGDVSVEERDRVWGRLRAAHEAWDAAGRP